VNVVQDSRLAITRSYGIIIAPTRQAAAMRLKRLPRLGTSNPSQPGSLLRTVVLSDLVDSTALIERVGDQAAADLIVATIGSRARSCSATLGREVDKTDGFLILFERPVEAVAFALEYQRKLKAFAGEAGQPLSAPGRNPLWGKSSFGRTRRRRDQGSQAGRSRRLAKPIAARLMGLALRDKSSYPPARNRLHSALKSHRGNAPNRCVGWRMETTSSRVWRRRFQSTRWESGAWGH
jgi:hypothetical protein